ncbi:MAG: cytochrome c oxidase subunit II [Anaerolineales bacterium]|jgi:cytochrome c oxidase subunit 2|nr:cytochrome c oxidase subunit II [Anaerolineales bacterium]MBX3005993.1 cytochrome c oxidase subunit II [Anaerolineales bacterium]MCW5838650.1 cytochrome c oxidase subunit II [Anaerolineales bacterium]MCW5887912.1 cytochrome c oxidase subunit II [Anaerolineales bacterium]
MIHLLIVGVLVVISTIGMGLLFTSGILLPAQASQQAITVDWLFNLHFWFIAFFVSLITVFVLYSVFVFRRKKGEKGDGVYMEGNQRLEIVWTIIPIGIVLWMAVIGGQTLSDVERRDPDAITVDVYAAQWSWRFEYEVTTPEGINTAVASDTLVLPRNRQVLLRLHSQDVIHSFFVPEFRVKQDILPGGEEYVRELRITPNTNGLYTVECAELCGQGHYSMLAQVQVVDGSEFSSWLTEQSGECNLSDAECGARWAQTFGCLGCHTTDGTPKVGPTWLGLPGHTVELADGSTVTADTQYLRASIVDPNAQIVAGYQPNIMPQNFDELLNAEQIDQIVAFIESLQ